MTGDRDPSGSGDGDWIAPPSADASDDAPTASTPLGAHARLGKTVALVAAGVLAGGGIAVAVTHDSSNATAATGPARGNHDGAFPGAPGGAAGAEGGVGPGGIGGIAGEQRLQGTLTAVRSGSVTVKTSAGTHTYQVTSQSQIVKNGTSAALSQLKVGDAVLVHVYPSGSRMLIERIFAGQLPAVGDGGLPRV
jgi:hypothetical protein